MVTNWLLSYKRNSIKPIKVKQVILNRIFFMQDMQLIKILITLKDKIYWCINKIICFSNKINDKVIWLN